MKKLITIYFLLFYGASIFAQTIPMPKIESPNASSLGIFGEIPVSYFTGTPEISIPIYNITEGLIKVPIALRYHPALVKPNEHPGWTGLGWSLQCTGSITRTINYWHDERDVSTLGGYYPNGYKTPGSTIVNSKNWSDELAALKSIFHSTEVKLYDEQADEFSFNFLGYSGKFFYTANGWTIVSDHNIKVEINGFINQTQIDQELQRTYFTTAIPSFTGPSRMFMGFTLTTDDGTKYIFGSTSSNNLDAIEFSGTYSQKSSSNPGLLVKTWFLKKIVDKFNNEITFTYDREWPICKLSFFSNYVANSCYYDWYTGVVYNNGQGTGLTVNTAYHDGDMIIPVYLKRISSPNHEIIFSTSVSDEKKYSDLFLRYSFDNDGNANGALELNLPYVKDISNLKWEKLDVITIKDKSNNPIKSFNFNYVNPSDKRLCLGSLTEKSSSDIVGKKYSFLYNNIESLPEYGGDKTDHWGYFNDFSIDGRSFSTLVTDRNTNKDKVTIGLLNTINYPTGGYTTFSWEANDYLQYVGLNRKSVSLARESNLAYAGGVRIKEMKSYPDASSQPVVKTYLYNNTNLNLLSSGVLNGKPIYVFDIPQRNIGGVNTVSHHLESVHSLGNYSYNTSGSHIGYTEVTEKNGDGSYTKYFYTNFDPDLDNNSHPDKGAGLLGWKEGEDPYIRMSDLSLERGKINGIFKYNNADKCIEKTIYHYRTDEGRFNNYIRRIESRNSYGCENYALLILASAFKEYKYNYYVVKEDHYLYNQNGENPFFQSIDYTYNSFNQLIKKEQTNQSNGKSLSESFTYPTDVSLSAYSLPNCSQLMSEIEQGYNARVTYCTNTYSDPDARRNCILGWWTQYPGECHDGEGNFLYSSCLSNCQSMTLPPPDSEASAVLDLISRNEIGRPLQTVKTVDNKVVSASYTKELTINSLTLPRTHFELDLASPASSLLSPIQPYINNQGQYFKSGSFDSNAEKVYFDLYDNKGNLLQYHKKSHMGNTYIWGYNQTYPVVKIVGIDYNSINSSIKTNVEGRTYTSSSSYVNVKVDVDYLKGQLNSLMSDSRYSVTIYTYAPLFGMTSQTDPNGVTTYYEYDSFGRLKCIKDDDGRILKTYEYNYKQ